MTKEQIEQLGDIKAIKAFFDSDQKVTMAEFKAFSKVERKELGDLCREEMISRL